MLKKIFITLSCLIFTTVATAESSVSHVTFDFGGVIAKADTAKMADFLMNTFSINRDELSRAFKEMQECVSMGGSEKEFWKKYAQTKQVILPEGWFEQFREVIKESLIEFPETIALVKSLQDRGYKTPMLSDVTQYQMEVVRSMGYYKLFDPVLLSCETGYKKPDPESFNNLLRTLQLPPSKVLFIDDRIENVESARKLGIDSIQFIDPNQLDEELLKRGLL